MLKRSHIAIALMLLPSYGVLAGSAVAQSPPVPRFTISGSEPGNPTVSTCVGACTPTFDARAAYDPDGGPVTASWDLSYVNGTPSFDRFGPVVSWTYPSPGSYGIILEVRDDEGQVAQQSGGVFVAAPPEQPAALDIFGISASGLSSKAVFGVRSPKRVVEVKWRGEVGGRLTGANALVVPCPSTGSLARLRCFRIPAATSEIDLNVEAYDQNVSEADYVKRQDPLRRQAGRGWYGSSSPRSRRGDTCRVTASSNGAVAASFGYVGRLKVKVGKRTLANRKKGRRGRKATQAPIEPLGSVAASVRRRRGTSTMLATPTIRTLGKRYRQKTRVARVNLRTCRLGKRERSR